jgi:hypothetical protein
MKKLFALMMVAGFAATIVACGGKKEEAATVVDSAAVVVDSAATMVDSAAAATDTTAAK